MIIGGEETELLPVALLFALGASRVFFAGRFRTERAAERARAARRWGDALAALLGSSRALVLPAPSIVPYWDPLARTVVRAATLRWVPPREEADATTAASSSCAVVRRAFLDGPLGRGAGKVVNVAAAIVLWRILHGEWPPIRWFGNERPGLREWGIVSGICLGVNGVLFAWNRVARSRGRHEGVRRMVAASRGRESLTRGEVLLYGCLAFANAVCEEVSFRWFWRAEFAVYLSARDANLAQAAVFGTLHYYGVPSGFAGVGLTFCYGWIMGLLMDHVGGGGLFLPVVAHTIADYYIFSSVARSKIGGKSD